jgi:hypothetical protein
MSGEKSQISGDSPLGDRDAFSHTTTSPNDSSRPLFTPGPWAMACSDGAIVRGKRNRNRDKYTFLADCCSGMPECHEEDVANAHLIAAAPELYVVVRDMVAEFDLDRGAHIQEGGGDLEDTPLIRAARQALSKARGEQK